MTYTQEDLSKIRLQYNTNFERLLSSHPGTQEHARYAKLDEILYKREEKIQRALGVYAKDPCVLSTKTYECEDCIGYYKKRYKDYHNGKGQMINVPCKVKRGTPCPYKKYAKQPWEDAAIVQDVLQNTEDA